ncbi:MAG: Cu(I)/Ag(I) efflux system membrane fusion protein [Planctomycetota bacterium]|jgi:Cu(I)/Ag(I) efflux system membrane fusion protein
MKPTNKVLIITGAALALLALGRSSSGWGGASDANAEQHAHDEDAGGEEEDEASLWTCPMHPQIKLPDFGACPICGMDLVEMTGAGDDNPRQLVMSPASKALARIVTEPVRRKNVTRPVRLVGKVDYDETAVRTISAWVAGRIDRLYVDYTGVRVNEGDHLVWLYSPDLLTAQEELLSAKARVKATAGESSEFLASSNADAYTSSREKLLLWGLTEEQVVEIEERGTANDRVMLTSPTTGVVIDKMLDEGAYVQTGTHIYRIADLSQLWLRLDAYEQDLAWLRHGQQVVVEVEALPGDTFKGTISYIDPFIHEHTRTAKVRVIVDNSNGRLKPGMFVRAVASARLGMGGAVLSRQLAGKWVSPMHPEVVKDGPGKCDVCGMDLVRAEDLGLVPDVPATSERPLVIPSSAVLITGKRAVVYIEVPDADQPTYEGREVVLGPRAGDEYMVLKGLEDGERIVVNGAFRIDSSMQILAKPSMMGIPGEANGASGPEATVFREALAPLYTAYLKGQVALAGDDPGSAGSALKSMGQLLEDVSPAGLSAEHRTLWREEVASLRAAIESAAGTEAIEPLRESFEAASISMLTIVREFGHDASSNLVEAYCPMAFNDAGASWLQEGRDIRNPYFGASMLACGDVREEFITHGELAEAAPMDHAAMGHDHDAPTGSGMDTAMGSGMDGAEPSESALAAVFTGYLKLQSQLADDAAQSAHMSLKALLDRVIAAAADATLPESTTMRLHKMHSALLKVGKKSDIALDRAIFRTLSEHILAIEKAGGNPLAQPLSVVHCPMAFEDEGADWLQAQGQVDNPYFGASMLRCGAVTREVSSK